MRILITGSKGQLGRELFRQLENTDHTVVGVDIEDVDISKLDAAVELAKEVQPDVLLNCAAFTNVDLCEDERDAAFAANALGPRNVAVACEEVGAKLIHISTDYVFSGKGEIPFTETDIPAPKTVYGATKLLGEQYVRQFCSRWFILRTAWLYGRDGNNFVKTILRLAKEKGEMRVVDDQRGNPTCAEDLARHMLKLAPTKEYGLYHCTANGICSWYDFAREIVRLSGIEAAVYPCTTEEYPRPAPRPAYSALDNSMLRATIGDEMRPWLVALEDYMRHWEEYIG